MSDRPKKPAKSKEERLAEALRNNLRRRKQGAKSPKPEPSSPATEK